MSAETRAPRFRIRRVPIVGRAPWRVVDTKRGTTARTWDWARAVRFAFDTLAHEAGPIRGDGIPWDEA